MATVRTGAIQQATWVANAAALGLAGAGEAGSPEMPLHLVRARSESAAAGVRPRGLDARPFHRAE
jgi:hypothetical protein